MQKQLDLHRGLEREARGGKLSPASIIIRDLRFLRGGKVQRWWAATRLQQLGSLHFQLHFRAAKLFLSRP
jgi:hypothetical protein